MKKILVVDNDEKLLRLYQKELSAEGYEVETAASAKEAYLKAETKTYDVIILEIVMPEINGLEAMQHFFHLNRKQIIILNTNHPHYRDDFAAWGADAFVVKKEGDLAELKKEIGELLGL